MKVDLTGRKFGMLSVVEEAVPIHYSAGKPNRRWLLLCDCGNTTYTDQMHLTRRTNSTKSCGCVSKRKKYQTKSQLYYRRLYTTWNKVLYRCENPKSTDWHKYGARGIKVSEEWHDFPAFYSDMVDGYKPGLTIERKDVNGNYCKENCTWITNEDQAKNRRTTRWVKGLCAKDACKKYNVPYQRFGSFVRKGYSNEVAFELASQG